MALLWYYCGTMQSTEMFDSTEMLLAAQTIYSGYYHTVIRKESMI